jgi:hypothetical protein
MLNQYPDPAYASAAQRFGFQPGAATSIGVAICSLERHSKVPLVRHDPGSGFRLKTVARSALVDAMWRDDNPSRHEPVPSVDGEAVEQTVAAGAP